MKKFALFLAPLMVISLLTNCGNKTDPTPPGPKQYTVTFDLNGGTSEAIPTQTVVEGGKATRPDNPDKITAQGTFTFICWELDNTEFDFDTPIIQDITLVAKWGALSECTFILNSCSLNQTLKFKFGANDTFESIDWGDGSSPDTNIEHTYSGTSVKKTYKIIIKNPRISLFSLDNCTAKANIIYANIPNAVTLISEYAFRYCSSLSYVNIPISVTEIQNNAFDSCSSLSSINIPKNVTSIGKWAFVNCSSLTSIIVDSSNLNYDSRGECNAIISKSNNELIVGCKNTIIPDNVALIGDYAFFNCSSLSSINIPNSVTKIKDYAFRGCSSLSSINIPNSVTMIGDAVFAGCTSLTSIFIPSSVITMGTNVFNGCSELIEIRCQYEESEKPGGWNDNWKNGCNAKVTWGVPQTIIPSNTSSILIY